MNKININKNNLNNKLYGNFENKSVIDNIFKSGGSILPKPVTYNEIHDEFVNFVKVELETKHENEIIPTFYYSQQRFSEFSKTWEHVDENKNIQANFKIITRENNPKKGTALGDYFNIPGNEFYTLGTSEKMVNGKNISISYKTKQPYCVDFIYEVKIITNKMDLLNEFNNKVQDVFKSKQAYIRPNGHFMTITLEDISDESDYDLDERKVFVQTFQFKILGYIINEDDLIIEENIYRGLISIGVDTSKPNLGGNVGQNGNIVVEFPKKSSNIISFKSSTYCSIMGIGVDNVSDYIVQVNGLNIVGTSFELKKYDRVNIKINRNNIIEKSIITLIK